VTVVGCRPPVSGSPSLCASKSTPDCTPVNASLPWFETSEPFGAGGVTGPPFIVFAHVYQACVLVNRDAIAGVRDRDFFDPALGVVN